MLEQPFIAHVRQSDGKEQPLIAHLTGTAAIAKQLAEKIGLPLCGELIGLLHDLGKYSTAFQAYIRDCIKHQQLNQLDEDETAELIQTGKPKRGSVDHSTAGAQFIYQRLCNISSSVKLADGSKLKRGDGELLANMLFICIASHHSGLVNVVDASGQPYLSKRQIKPEQDTHLAEVSEQAQHQHLTTHLDKQTLQTLIVEFNRAVSPIINAHQQSSISSKQLDFYIGFFTRLLFSCLIDADRSNSIAFEHPEQAHLLNYKKPNWQHAINKLESVYDSFAQKAEGKPLNALNAERSRVAQTCFDKGSVQQGIYTLTVPTGGGKTLASLRFALQHANKHNLDRIVYIIPFTSIIEQNAQEIRKILEEKLSNGSYVGDWVLEQHSNLEPNVQTWQSKLVMDNWNAPIVFTTMVQFLESCFAGGTKGVRRLHQLSRSVLIFDEIQTLPIQCYYLYCNAINFLTSYGKTTAILCTATQPVLSNLPDPTNQGKGALNPATEIIGDAKQLTHLFNVLERVDVNDYSQPKRNLEELSTFIRDIFEQTQSTLVIVNTKTWAKQLYQQLASAQNTEYIFHLSTGQCAQHRKDMIAEIKRRLGDEQPTFVISTQLIEAGVDISFKSVVRFLAGLDSIAQAAGRCNRHGQMRDNAGKPCKGQVYVVCPDKENLQMLPTIDLGKSRTQDILNIVTKQSHSNSSKTNHTPPSLLSVEMMQRYFNYFNTDTHMQQQMSYPVKGEIDDTLLNWLSDNPKNGGVSNDNKQRLNKGQFPRLFQSFMDAGRVFKAINAPTHAIVVPYGKAGNELIKDLHGTEVSDKSFYQLARKAQAYSINVFAHTFKQLQAASAIKEVRDTGILTLDGRFYNDEMGLDINGAGQQDFLNFSD